jgi:UDP-N-acetylglucosamine--N-acetylmuramyl-(pentapeptide) pyrophosphoryl-undecaprenol N-acetylglucosamine transferase
VSAKSLIIAGGGTGGHVLAGVAVADSWKQSYGEDARILFVGARGGIEEKLVPRAGYPLELLELGSLNRVSLSRKLKTLFQLPLSLFKSAQIILKQRPDAVLGVGGYASGPLVLMARVLALFGLSHAKTAILEQNSVPGLTNRILGRAVHQVFSAFPGMEKHFNPGKLQVTGNPVRAAVVEAGSRAIAGDSEIFTVFVFGGSQGAIGINTLVLDALPFLKDRLSRLRFVHQTGEKDFERVKQAYSESGVLARVEKFIYDMPEVYMEASLVVCRSGSSTLSEIAAVGKPSVLVPFPFASDNHQEHNARIFTNAGAAFLLVQSKATGEDLAKIIRELMDHPNQREELGKRVRSFFKPDSAGEIRRALAKASGAQAPKSQT